MHTLPTQQWKLSPGGVVYTVRIWIWWSWVRIPTRYEEFVHYNAVVCDLIFRVNLILWKNKSNANQSTHNSIAMYEWCPINLTPSRDLNWWSSVSEANAMTQSHADRASASFLFTLFWRARHKPIKFITSFSYVCKITVTWFQGPMVDYNNYNTCVVCIVFCQA
jgi:hypothetical protein